METVEVKAILNVDSHLQEVTIAQEERLRAAVAKAKSEGKPEGKPEKKSEPLKSGQIRFVSQNIHHVIATDEGSIKFDDFLYLCEPGSREEAEIRSVMQRRSDLHEVLDEPFEDEELKARMAEHLEEMALFENLPLTRGVAYLKAHLSREELAKMSKSRHNVRMMILRILETKSYSDWRK